MSNFNSDCSNIQIIGKFKLVKYKFFHRSAGKWSEMTNVDTSLELMQLKEMV